MDRKLQRCLLLALGNDILGNDGAGFTAARLLREEFEETVDIVEAPGARLVLLELLESYDQVLLLDAIFSGSSPPGTVLEFCRDDFRKTAAPSAHYVGLPEVLRQAESLGMQFPRELRILVLEVENPFEFQEGIGPATQKALPDYVDRARQVLQNWIT
jgi:hydrogenase maturation protease